MLVFNDRKMIGKKCKNGKTEIYNFLTKISPFFPYPPQSMLNRLIKLVIGPFNNLISLQTTSHLTINFVFKLALVGVEVYLFLLVVALVEPSLGGYSGLLVFCIVECLTLSCVVIGACAAIVGCFGVWDLHVVYVKAVSHKVYILAFLRTAQACLVLSFITSEIVLHIVCLDGYLLRWFIQFYQSFAGNFFLK